jgi:aspartyl/asparaginyl-tRNA synthetase
VPKGDGRKLNQKRKENQPMKNKLIKLSAITLLVSAYAIVSAAKEVRWDEADKYYGQTVTVTGIIVATHNSGRACFLNFHQNYKLYFTAVIFASDFSKFPSSPENYYLNKEVKVTGLVKEYQGKPEIILQDPTQIQIVTAQVENQPEPKVVQQPSSSASDLATQVELLSKKVESQESKIKALEQRVEKLESVFKEQK